MKIKPLTEEEKKELEILDNPEVEFTSSPHMWGIVANFFNRYGGQRKGRVVELKVRMRVEELGLNIKKNDQRYHRIRMEEERNFDRKFKAKQIGWYNEPTDDFLCVDCFSKLKSPNLKNYKPIRSDLLEKDTYTCDKCKKVFD